VTAEKPCFSEELSPMGRCCAISALFRLELSFREKYALSVGNVLF
jgi:hypothetical protein